jgi:hypothetical protein
MVKIVLLKRVLVVAMASLALSLQTFAAEVGNADALLKAINAQKLDVTINVLNQVKQARHRGDVLPLLLALWNNDKKKHPDLPWGFVNLDVVRVNIADILVQAYRNGQVDVDRVSVHAFTKKVAAQSADAQARGAALLVLGMIDDPRDVQLLRLAALEERELVSSSAIASLGMMCNADAGKALGSLVTTLKGKQFMERARDARQLHLDMVKSKGGWCTQRPFV